MTEFLDVSIDHTGELILTNEEQTTLSKWLCDDDDLDDNIYGKYIKNKCIIENF